MTGRDPKYQGKSDGGEAELSREGLQFVGASVHTYESFARALAQGILDEAAERVGDQPRSSVDLEVPVTVTAIALPESAAGLRLTWCAEVCVTIRGWRVCVKVCGSFGNEMVLLRDVE